MSNARLIRWSGLAALLGGLLMILGSINWEQPPWSWLGTLGSIVLVFGLMGIYALQVEESGLAGFLGFVFIVAGGMLLMGPGELFGVAFELLGSLLSAAGLLLLALGTLASRKFPRWVAWLWLVALVVGLPAVFVPSLEGAVGMLASAAAGLGMAGAGYTLWSRPS